MKLFILVFTLLLPASLLAQGPLLQDIRGAHAFPIDEDQAAVRISVAPNGLNIKGDPKKTLEQLVVVACVEGRCEFARPNVGLGFFETKFPAPKLSKSHSFNTLVIACSRLGCVKTNLTTRVLYPQSKD